MRQTSIAKLYLDEAKFFDEAVGPWLRINRVLVAYGGETPREEAPEVQAQRADNPGLTETRTWGSYEKVTVIRRATEEGKR